MTNRIMSIDIACGHAAALAAFQAVFPSCAGVSIDDLADPARASTLIDPDGSVEAGYDNGLLSWVDLVSATSKRRFCWSTTRSFVTVRFGAAGSHSAAAEFLTTLSHHSNIAHLRIMVWAWRDGELIGTEDTPAEHLARLVSLSEVA